MIYVYQKMIDVYQNDALNEDRRDDGQIRRQGRKDDKSDVK